MEKKNFIIDKARRLFCTLSTHSVSMDDIVRECGISKKTIYAHFENKFEIVRLTAQLHCEEIEQSLKTINLNACNPIDELNSLFEYFHSFHHRVSPVTIKDLKKYHLEVYEKSKDVCKSFLSEFLKRTISHGVQNGWYLPVDHIDQFTQTYVAFNAFIILQNEPYLIKEHEALQFGKLLINVLADKKSKDYLKRVFSLQNPINNEY